MLVGPSKHKCDVKKSVDRQESVNKVTKLYFVNVWHSVKKKIGTAR